MTVILYSEINIFCFLILLMLSFKVATGVDKQNTQRLFFYVLVSQMIFFVLDLLWVWIDGRFFAAAVWMNWLVNALYYIQAGIGGFAWLIYSESMQASPIAADRKKRFLAAIPLGLLVVLTVASYWNGWIFFIDENNNYHRGVLHFFQLAVTYGYTMFTAGKAFVLALRKENMVNRTKYLTLASYVVCPLIFGTAQILFPGQPLLCMGITLSFLNVYFTLQQQLVSVDPLTQLNNRNQLMRTLDSRIAHFDGRTELYLLIMDVDLFKKINDKYGHVEGDAAIVRVADALKYACAEKNHFVCRYGGDEFILCCEVESEAEVRQLCRDIQERVTAAGKAAKARYELTLSIGFSKYTTRTESIQEWIEQADSLLYKIKREKKKLPGGPPADKPA